MPRYWLLKGDYHAPGWNALRKNYDDKKVETVHLDPKSGPWSRPMSHRQDTTAS